MVCLLQCVGMCALLAVQTGAAALKYTVPFRAPDSATPVDCTPIGLSFEFYMWPSYMTNITPPMHCTHRMSDIYGKRMPIRIGGTTQDRATYDSNFDGYVSYRNDDPLVAPMELTYGPKFWDLIPVYGGETMLGFNRGDNNRTNTFMAVEEARRRAGPTIWAIELGNEPGVYSYWNKSIATPPWNASQEGEDAADWAQDFINTWKLPNPILTAGSYAANFPDTPTWPNVPYLIHTAFNETIKAAIKYYSGHLYAAPPNETDLAGEMNHAKTVADLSVFAESIEAAHSVGRPYILGESSFHPFDVRMDETFGAALAALDKSMRGVTMGIDPDSIKALFNWWSDNQINSPFYGGYMAVLALANGDSIIELDQGGSSYAAYVIYRRGEAAKVLLINTDYYDGTGKRPITKFTLDGLQGRFVEGVRLTAATSEITTTAEQIRGSPHPTLGGNVPQSPALA
ncbi:uncharacterized protein BDV17DRAFT_289095 [Aspergillus undulatus]|uniref:uncharacterized protein n=1 Tax=Aspergillus undulatus TaxID=1810928 RepID=UPI003CCD7DFD